MSFIKYTLKYFEDFIIVFCFQHLVCSLTTHTCTHKIPSSCPEKALQGHLKIPSPPSCSPTTSPVCGSIVVTPLARQMALCWSFTIELRSLWSAIGTRISGQFICLPSDALISLHQDGDLSQRTHKSTQALKDMHLLHAQSCGFWKIKKKKKSVRVIKWKSKSCG